MEAPAGTPCMSIPHLQTGMLSEPVPSPHFRRGSAVLSAVVAFMGMAAWDGKWPGLLSERRAAAAAEADVGTVPVTATISVGAWQTCAVGANGAGKCWGNTCGGDVGDRGGAADAVPVCEPIENAVEFAAGYTHTCALDGAGAVWCWGDNRDGELGDGTREHRTNPAQVRGLSDLVSIAAGTFHTCALRVDGVVFCWGNGILGTLGDGRNHTSDLPVPVFGVTDALAIAGGESHACAIHASGRLSCWGRNTWGQLGDGTTDDSNVPRVVMAFTGTSAERASRELEGAVAVGAGYAHTCAMLVDGTVTCWGANWHGQLGNGTTTGVSSPTAVSGLSRVKALSLGNLNSCAILADGTARCWGSNAFGQIGDGTMRDALEAATPVLGAGDSARPLSGLRAIATGDHTCGVDVFGGAWCWGANYAGQVGDGTREDRSLPVPVVSLR